MCRLKFNKILSAAVIIINLIGCVCLVIFAVPYLTHDTFVRNPDAMLPMESWDSAGMALTIGFIPLLAANIIAFAYLPKAKIKNPMRLLFFAPSLMCLSLVICYFATSLAN